MLGCCHNDPTETARPTHQKVHKMSVWIIEYVDDDGLHIISVCSSKELANKLCFELESKRIQLAISSFGILPDWMYEPRYNAVNYILDDNSYAKDLIEHDWV